MICIRIRDSAVPKPTKKRKELLPFPAANDKMKDNMSNPSLAAGDIPVQRAGNEKKSKKSSKKKHSLPFLIFKKLIMVIATTLLSLFLVIVITGTIVCSALTVYVLDFMDDSTNITLQELESGSDTYFYGISKDENGREEIVILNRVKTDVQRIPVDIEKLPQYVRDAFVYTEDERFYTHDGVDYKRTFQLS